MGKRIALSSGKRLVGDVIHLANRMPIAGLSGDFDFAAVADLRRRARPKISWNILFLKAYAMVCREMPELLQGHVAFPWPCLYEHHEPVGMITVSRIYRGEERLFFGRFSRPDEQSLAYLQRRYDRMRKAPVESIKQFRHQMLFAAAPLLLRRLVWWTLFNVWPVKRATHMGTFGMSISGHNGVYGSKHLSPSTTTLGVDPMPRQGQARLVLTFDHRVIDGTPATRIFQCLEQKVKSEIANELASLIQHRDMAKAG